MGSDVLARDRAARAALRAAVGDLRDARVRAGEEPDVPRRWSWVVVAVVVASVLLAGWGVWRWSEESGRTTDAEYERIAADRVTMLLSPDYRQPGRAQRILAGATGEFYDEFAQSADAYTTFVKSRGTVAEGTVDGAAISGRASGNATVLVAATVRFTGSPDTRSQDTRSQDTRSQDTRTQGFRLRVLLTDSDGGPKLAAVQYLP